MHPNAGSAHGGSPLDADSAPPTSSAAWITAVQSGDGTSVWTLLEERYQEDLLLFARHQIGLGLARRVEPQDLVQEAWLRSLRGLHEFHYQGPGSFRRWLKTLIARVAKDEARRGRVDRESNAERDALEAVVATTAHSPSHIAARIERAARVWEALHDPRMPALYREVFVGSVIEELPSEALAQQQGVKADTIRQQVRRARLLLQGILGFDR